MMNKDTYQTVSDNIVAYLGPLMNCTDMGPEKGCAENSLFLALYELGDNFFGPAAYGGLWPTVRKSSEAWEVVRGTMHALAVSFYMRCMASKDGLVDLEINLSEAYPLQPTQLRIVFFYWMRQMSTQMRNKGWKCSDSDLTYWLNRTVESLYPDVQPYALPDERIGLGYMDRL